MSQLVITLNRAKIPIDRQAFTALFSMAPNVRESAPYKAALRENTISFRDLKKLATDADVPYPLFFAPLPHVEAQIEDHHKNLADKFPAKSEIALSHRGTLNLREIQLVVKDFAKKQEFLKKYILPKSPDNDYVGALRKKLKQGSSVESVAQYFKEFFDLDLKVLRTKSKEGALRYVTRQAESKSVFISYSSYNYMPQNIERNAEFSGICIKDKKFPFVFINTRDGDEEPLILESSGRQIFTLVSMLVSIGLNIFAINIKKGGVKNPLYELLYNITEEILVPQIDLQNVQVTSIDDLTRYSDSFKVTPSMLLVRLEHLRKIPRKEAARLRGILKTELTAKKPSQKRSVLPVNGYRKYNGERFSYEVLNAHKSQAITFEQVKNVLFRKGKKMDAGLFQQYSRLFIP